MLDRGVIAGWLGIEASGELSNACVEKGYHWNRALRPLISRALAMDRSHSAFVYVPVEKLSSAFIFMDSGMVLPDEHKLDLKTVSYPEASIQLVKLISPQSHANRTRTGRSRRSLVRSLKDLRLRLDAELAHPVHDPS